MISPPTIPMASRAPGSAQIQPPVSTQRQSSRTPAPSHFENGTPPLASVKERIRFTEGFCVYETDHSQIKSGEQCCHSHGQIPEYPQEGCHLQKPCTSSSTASIKLLNAPGTTSATGELSQSRTAFPFSSSWAARSGCPLSETEEAENTMFLLSAVPASRCP